jgi:DNA-binding beta-propeller fold protein YncE
MAITMRRHPSGAVSTFDTTTHSVTATLELTDFFIARVARTPNGNYAYVANTASGTVIDAITVGAGAFEVAVDPF